MIRDRVQLEIKRAEASVTIAWFVEHSGHKWTSLRDALKFVADLFDIQIEGRRRTPIAIHCLDALHKRGMRAPAGYVVPWKRGNRPPVLHSKKVTASRALDFYQSQEWKRLRYAILLARGRQCECCGAKPPQAVIVVDHIQSVRKRWDLRLEAENLQVLCDDCNKGKRADTMDFRAVAASLEPGSDGTPVERH